MANAEVRVFAPGDPDRTALTGRTDATGKFVFDADRDGLWGAEAGSADYVARVMIRVGGETQSQNWLSPFVLVGFLAGPVGHCRLVPPAARLAHGGLKLKGPRSLSSLAVVRMPCPPRLPH